MAFGNVAAEELLKKADAKLQSSGFLSFLSGGPKYDEASELYQQAANQFKLLKRWQEAGNCFNQCAFCAEKTGSSSDQANFLTEAGNVLKKISTSSCLEPYEKAVSIYSSSGRFQQAGKLLTSIAELFEAERLSHTEAKEYYERAVEMFELDEHGKSNLSKCNLKVAEYSAKDGQLDEAIKIFELEGEKALQNTLLQYGAKEHFFKAGILHLAKGDSVSISLSVEKYRNMDPRFSSCREGELLQGLSDAFSNSDVDAFMSLLGEYDSVTKLDGWKTEFLVKAKEHLQPSSATDSLDLS